VEKIGVLLVQGQHRILSDIVRDVLEADSSVELVGQVASIEDTVDAIARSRCDAVVWMVDDARQAEAPVELLRHAPGLRIVAIEGGGREGSMWRMRPQRERLGQLSPARIIEELRGRA
jgi:DNA-binding NarL/FixJ family response regulator